VPLYIRDDEVAELARAVQAASGARTVTDAVRAALQRERDRLRDDLPPSARLGKALELADAIGRGPAPT
jgi:antitoxin VapB